MTRPGLPIALLRSCVDRTILAAFLLVVCTVAIYAHALAMGCSVDHLGALWGQIATADFTHVGPGQR
jgi:hypothetical protein